MADHLVIVDDNFRFVVHVWQHLAGGLAFGIGELKKANAVALFSAEGEPRGLPTPDFATYIWWVDASANQDAINKDLEAAMAQIDKEPCRFLIDVCGPGSHAGQYFYSKVIRLIRAKRPGIPLKLEKDAGLGLISAYSRGFVHYEGELLPVHEKLPQIVASFVSEVPGSAARPPADKAVPDPPPTASPLRHVLITGAGFEFPSRILKEASKGSLEDPLKGLSEKRGIETLLGIPDTASLIEEALSTPREGDKLKLVWKVEDGKKVGFPYPEHWHGDSQLKRQGEAVEILDTGVLHSAAKKRDLDQYWNSLLELEFRSRVSTSGKSRADRKLEASEWEYQLRESFRQVFLKYDWGFLNQAVHAAGMDWDVWLTTNYTRFTDRAIDRSTKRWRVISTSNEAARLMREILYGQNRGPGNRTDTLLFKLHGDLGHLTTMAIAGHDKEISTPLSFPIDSLHQIYVAAEYFLRGVVAPKDPKRKSKELFVWHIVGHGLADELLCRTIGRIFQDSPDRNQHRFLVVNPYCQDPIDRLVSAKIPRSLIHGIPLGADEYMACLSKRGLSDFNDFKDLTEFLTVPIERSKSFFSPNPQPKQVGSRGGRSPKHSSSAR